jgi:hypothetical protein
MIISDTEAGSLKDLLDGSAVFGKMLGGIPQDP